MAATWSTLESDEDVFSHYIQLLGVNGVQAEELLTLEPESLAKIEPYGLIFLFKYSGTEGQQRTDIHYDSDAASKLFFAWQTVENACAAQAILSILLNTKNIDIGEKLNEWKDFTMCIPPNARGDALADFELIRKVHNSFTPVNPFEIKDDQAQKEQEDIFHYVSYIVVDDTLYELDGMHRAPITHGRCTQAEFPEKMVKVLQERIASFPSHEIRFNLIAITPDRRERTKQDPSLTEQEKHEILAIEAERREYWTFDEKLRRHNFIGLINNLFECIVEDKVRNGSFDTWLLRCATKQQSN